MSARVYERSFQHLEDLLSPHIGRDDLHTVRRAFGVAEKAHAGQMRDEGTPYILHPLRVAIILSEEMKIYSPPMCCSALLHDVVEDTPITREQIAEWFGPEVAEVVWLL